MRKKSYMLGVSLLELMLVLVIGASLILFSLQQYVEFKDATDQLKITSDVNSIFNAASQFYQAQCQEATDSNGNILRSGFLDPANAASPAPTTYELTNSLVPAYLNKWPEGPPGLVHKYYA